LLSLHHQRQSDRTLLVYLFVSSLYLLYLPDAQFVLDDWFVMGRYQQAREAGWSEQFHVFRQIVQNQFHGQFRFQWLSFSLAYVLWLLVGYAPGIIFLASLALHVGCAAALRRALTRLGIAVDTAALAGVFFLLLPTTHGALLWSFNCTFFLWSTLWFLLYLGALAETLRTGWLTAGAAVRQAGFLLLAMFSGDPVFGLLLAAAPLAGWWLRSKAAWRATLLAWTVVAAGASFYAFAINRAPVFQAGVGVRYDFTPARFWDNLATIGSTYRKLTGVAPDSYYELSFSLAAVAAAVLAGAAAVWVLRRSGAPQPRRSALWLAGGMWIAAYGPIWFLRGHEFRYDYGPSVWIAVGLASAAAAWRGARAPLAMGLAAWLAMASATDVRRSWIPQSRSLQALEVWLRAVQVAPRDLIIVSGTTQWVGTAPHFAFLASWGSTPFAEHVAGVRPLETACEIVEDEGRLRVYHRNYMRDWQPEEAPRTRVAVAQGERPPVERTLLARQVRAGEYQLYALKGYQGPRIEARHYTREQLALVEAEVYFVRRLSELETK
jgi:hypothetical protein